MWSETQEVIVERDEEERGGRGGERNDEELNDVDSDEGTGFAAASERVQNHLPLRGGEVSESLGKAIQEEVVELLRELEGRRRSSIPPEEAQERPVFVGCVETEKSVGITLLERLDLLLEQIKALNDIICGLRGRIAAI